MTAPRTATCPTCKKPSSRENNKLFPFCCERCSMVDLGRWLAEDYRIPTDDDVPPPETDE